MQPDAKRVILFWQVNPAEFPKTLTLREKGEGNGQEIETTCISINTEKEGIISKEFAIEDSSETAEAAQLFTVVPNSPVDSDDDVVYTHGMWLSLRAS